MKLTFLGAAHTVTGSKYLIESKQGNYLVDCGLFQGLKEFRKRNWHEFPYPIENIDAIIITHAHIDHSGFLPRLFVLGYRGPVYVSPGTAGLLEILLPDSGYLQEEEAQYANLKGFARHKPALPLYTRKDAEESLSLLKIVNFHEPIRLRNGDEVTLFPVGHILGASFAYFKSAGKTIIFSGDVGRFDDLIMRAPELLPSCDYLVLESTYGDRIHPSEDVPSILEGLINKTVNKNGTILIPAFAVGRAQLILYIVNKLKKENKIPDVPVFLDSPMSIDATELYCKFSDEHRLSKKQCAEMCGGVTLVHTAEESKKLNSLKEPKIIISASGMISGGRVVHHLANLVADSKNTIILVGFQAAGTRGRTLLEGANDIKMFGQYFNVNADIEYIPGLSAHSDYKELISWLKNSKINPLKVFLTHGELSSAESFCVRLKDTFGWNVTVPKNKKTVDL